jgi:hypothetical protein
MQHKLLSNVAHTNRPLTRTYQCLCKKEDRLNTPIEHHAPATLTKYNQLMTDLQRCKENKAALTQLQQWPEQTMKKFDSLQNDQKSCLCPSLANCNTKKNLLDEMTTYSMMFGLVGIIPTLLYYLDGGYIDSALIGVSSAAFIVASSVVKKNLDKRHYVATAYKNLPILEILTKELEEEQQKLKKEKSEL